MCDGKKFDIKGRIFRQSLSIFADVHPTFLIQPPQLEETKEEFHSGYVLWLSPSGKVVYLQIVIFKSNQISPSSIEL